MSHGDDVKDEVFVPAFDQDEAVFGVEAAVELRLGKVEVDEAGRVLERVFVVLQLAEGAKDDHVGELAGRALKIVPILCSRRPLILDHLPILMHISWFNR